MYTRPSHIKTILSHLVFWIGYFAFLLFYLSGRTPSEIALLRSILFLMLQMIFAYTNVYFLMPRFFLEKRYVEYIFIVLVIFVGLFFIYDLIDKETMPQYRESMARKFAGNRGGPQGGYMSKFMFIHFRVIMNIILTTAIYLLSTAYTMISEANRREKEAALLKSEKLNSELKFLKSQINPHFLFNALNNIYALTVIKSDDAPSVILKLSDMLRYIIYDCNEDHVALKKEITYINNFIDLQKLKEEKQGSVEVDFEKADGGLLIAPLIFIPFIENSFKHSKIEDHESGWIRLKLETKDKLLIFEVLNSIPTSPHSKDAHGGIGLENVRKRLGLLYPGRHELQISEEEELFSVKLEIQL
ncbi:MAG: histidine kinase [Cyclobacteriaceae bacterium]|nr:histidine kinase [Cyclobacteriaceae bacterium]